jgi:hypothetical protein
VLLKRSVLYTDRFLRPPFVAMSTSTSKRGMADRYYAHHQGQSTEDIFPSGAREAKQGGSRAADQGHAQHAPPLPRPLMPLNVCHACMFCPRGRVTMARGTRIYALLQFAAQHIIHLSAIAGPNAQNGDACEPVHGPCNGGPAVCALLRHIWSAG